MCVQHSDINLQNIYCTSTWQWQRWTKHRTTQLPKTTTCGHSNEHYNKAEFLAVVLLHIGSIGGNFAVIWHLFHTSYSVFYYSSVELSLLPSNVSAGASAGQWTMELSKIRLTSAHTNWWFCSNHLSFKNQVSIITSWTETWSGCVWKSANTIDSPIGKNIFFGNMFSRRFLLISLFPELSMMIVNQQTKICYRKWYFPSKISVFVIIWVLLFETWVRYSVRVSLSPLSPLKVIFSPLSRHSARFATQIQPGIKCLFLATLQNVADDFESIFDGGHYSSAHYSTKQSVGNLLP